MTRGWMFLGVMGLALVLQSSAHAAIHVVGEVPTLVGPPVPDAWYSETTTGGTTAVVSLQSAGGNLENNQPMPVGAGRLTTVMDNDSRAAVTTYQDFGLASSVLNSVQLAYSFYKASAGDGNTSAAPAMRLQISSTSGYVGALIYEPYWNPLGQNPPVPVDDWVGVSINQSTGGTDGPNSGGWWWSKPGASSGFGQPNGAGGPPILSLAEWSALFTSTGGAEYLAAHVTGLSIGVGSYNQGQTGYFDAVSIQVGNGEASVYNFEPVPEPLAVLVWCLGGGVAMMVARRRLAL